MTPTERGRRSDALYMDNRYVNKRILCDMVAQRESDIEDLRDLVMDMYMCIRVSEVAGSVSEGSGSVGALNVEAFERRMRNLGVTVDG